MLPDKAKFTLCSINKLATIALMRHLVIGQRQKAPNFSAFHWSPHGCLITIGQHFVTTRVVHLPKRTETSLITESDQSRANHQLLQLCTVRTAWSDSDQAVRVVHSCKSWFHTDTVLVGKFSQYLLIPDFLVTLHLRKTNFICKMGNDQDNQTPHITLKTRIERSTQTNG